ncbi:MAG: hypothetical protein HY904_15150 [Deltaproteobacteria bacterium]|nr:hypothetical protein [Deltaproteobacteria bacterium]
MTQRLPPFSEIDEAASLAREIAVLGVSTRRTSRPPPASARARAVPPPAPDRLPPLPPRPAATGSYRSDRLGSLLAGMCHRGGFAAALLADRGGLALVGHNSAPNADRAAAFASIVGEAITRAETLLSVPQANNLALDINLQQKIVIHRFPAAGEEFLLMVTCDQDVDVRAETEATVEHLARELAPALEAG